MHVIVRFRAIVLGLAITVTGCASPPNADVDAAKAAVTGPLPTARAVCRRVAQGCAKCPDGAHVELKAQEGKLFKSYTSQGTRSRAKAAGDKAAADAVAGKEKADALAAKEKADAAAARAKARMAPLRVGGRIRAPKKIKDVKPVYPAMAQSARVAGAVTIEMTIGPDGKVIDAKVVRSIPLLDQAALDAVRQWE